MTDELLYRARLIDILERVATTKRDCRLCGATIYCVPVQRGSDKGLTIVYQEDGQRHKGNCPHEPPPKRTRGPIQTPLIDTTPVPD